MSALAEPRGATDVTARSATELPADWDRWLAAAGREASFTQTSHWALSHHLVNGAEPYAVEVTCGGARVAAALFGHARERSATVAGALKTVLAGRGPGWLECHGGPVITGADPAALLAALLAETQQLARRLGVRLVRFGAPPVLAAWPRLAETAAVFAAAGYRAQPWATSVVDLARQDGALLASFRPSARKGIRRCAELGIAVRPCTSAGEIEAKFIRAYVDTRRALGMAERTIVEVPWLQSERDPAYHFFIAEDRAGTVLGTLGTRRWNGIATEIYSERTMPAREKKLPVQDLLHWHAFQTHRGLGDRAFDLAGFNPAPSNDKEDGIKSFKEKWRGETVPLALYEKGSPMAAYRLARDLHTRLRRR